MLAAVILADRYMKHFRIVPLLVMFGFFTGCGNIRGFKLWAPESFGLIPIAENIYIELGADQKTMVELRAAMLKGEDAIRAAYGSVKSRPIIHACITERCYESFGGMGSRAKVYGDRILLSPRGFNWHFLVHEWSHTELRSRLKFFAWWRLPSWFDEGLAVSISEAPEHSEDHWQHLVAADIPRPTRAELFTYKSGRQWLDAVRRYGETQNVERRARGAPDVRPVYAAAGHEVRPWLAKVGTSGLLDLVERLNSGEEFDAVYQADNMTMERDGPLYAPNPRPSR